MINYPTRLETKSQILIAQTLDDIARCFATLKELRPSYIDKEAFILQIQRQITKGYILCYILDEGEAVSCIGFRVFETLAWGKILYIDDLITRESSRRKGFGRQLLAYAIEQGRIENCAQVHLDSGHHRFDAHRLYLNMGFKITCHHLAQILNG